MGFFDDFKDEFSGVKDGYGAQDMVSAYTDPDQWFTLEGGAMRALNGLGANWLPSMDTSDIVGNPVETTPQASAAIARLAAGINGNTYGQERARLEKGLTNKGLNEAAAASAGARFQRQAMLNLYQQAYPLLAGFEGLNFNLTNQINQLRPTSNDKAGLEGFLGVMG